MGVNKVVYNGGTLIDISDSTVMANKMLSGTIAYDKTGEPVAGNIPIVAGGSFEPSTSERTVISGGSYVQNDVKVAKIPSEYIKPSGTKTITSNGTHDVTNYASASVNVPSEEPALQEKTVSPSTSAQAVTPDSGYDGLFKVNVNAMPSATQATPSISVDSAGKITASATQTAGYVPSGTKSATKQLTTQAAKTVTPTTSNQTAVASGRYTTGAVTVKGDSNLVPANIVSGKSIFGVSGSATTGEDVTSETNAYTTELAELTTAVTALENELAGKAAGGGASVETCTVTVNFAGNADGYPSATGVEIICHTIVSGKPQVSRLETHQNTTSIDNVLVGTLFCITLEDFLDITGFNMTVQSLTLVDDYINTGDGFMFSVYDSQASITFS